MKRFTGLLLCVLLLAGCTKDDGLDRAMSARSKFQSTACRFRATVSADYGDMIHTFVMDCEADKLGNVEFLVVAPDAISGITGKLTGGSGFLTFDREILAFELLADGQLSPVSAPWVLISTLRGGYLRYAAETQQGLRLTVDDSYEDEPMQVDIWLEGDIPVEAEILWQGRRILTLRVEKFAFLEQNDDSGIG